MKFSVPFLIAALAASTQAVSLKYDAVSTSNMRQTDFSATLLVDNKQRMYAHSDGGESPWEQYGIHKIKLMTARTYGFNYCIDVFGNVSCSWVTTAHHCNKNNGKEDCNGYYHNDNYGV
ncbi:hypothetical protein BGX24_008642 [Mortierella sp. AD032]|nr:hypothetical protein BGX24_008642 [Mortierella sp. AD032]